MLWDVDYTLLDAGGSGRAVCRSVFRDLFGRDPDQVAPMGGRTERAIIADTLSMAGISNPPRHVDAFIAASTGSRRPPSAFTLIGVSRLAYPELLVELEAIACA